MNSDWESDILSLEELEHILCDDEDTSTLPSMNTGSVSIGTQKRKFAPVTAQDIENNIKSRIPKNTQAKIKWIMNIFDAWFADWHMRCDGLKVWKAKEEWFKSDLDYCLQYFFLEVFCLLFIIYIPYLFYY